MDEVPGQRRRRIGAEEEQQAEARPRGGGGQAVSGLAPAEGQSVKKGRADGKKGLPGADSQADRLRHRAHLAPTTDRMDTSSGGAPE